MKKYFAAFSALVFCLSALLSDALAQSGALDLTFNPGTGIASGKVRAITLQTNGSILIAGNFSSVNGVSRNNIARLNSDGGLDSGFVPGAGPGGDVLTMAVQTNGMVVIGGNFTFVNAIPRLYLARLRSDASLDLAFNPVANGPVESMLLQADGKILIAGSFTSVNSTNRNRIARLNSDGSLDLGFDPGLGANNAIHAIALQTNGMILVGGSFTTMNTSNRYYVARLNSDGSLDTGFDVGFVGGSFVSRLEIKGDGKAVIAGVFSSIDGYSRQSVAQLLTNGIVDASFAPQVGPLVSGDGIRALAVQPDGKVIVGGTFADGNGAVGAVRLNADGNIDSAFFSRVNLSVFSLAVQPDTKVLIGGDFFTVNGTNMGRIARLKGDGSPPAGLQFLAPNKYFGAYLSGTVSNSYRVEWTTDLNTPSLWTPLSNVTLQASPQFILDPTPAIGRQRYYRAVALP